MRDRGEQNCRRLAVVLAALASCSGNVRGQATTAPSLPHLQTIGAATQLIVGDQPILMLAGELGNSTASDVSTLDATFDKLHRMHLNTVMLPVYWDRFEPSAGTYDVTLLQCAIDSARRHDLHLVLLWFGSWKNSMSCYAPAWVKRDSTTYFRARRSSGEAMEILSPECHGARDADTRAFAALMRWVKAYDAARQTVLMVQVENEVGMIPEPRDHSPRADSAYAKPVPAEILQKLPTGELGPDITALWQKAGHKTDGAWADVLGVTPRAQEVFTAWELAAYVQHVAAAGKEQYPLPMFVNAALIRPGYTPGKYPSGGPLPHLTELWKAVAPAIDILSPDIDFPNFIDWARKYAQANHALLIPETAPSVRASANILVSIAQLNAIGAGPFAVEDLAGDKAAQLSGLYDLLSGIAPLVLSGQQQGRVIGLSPEVGFDWTVKDEPAQGVLGNYRFRAAFDDAEPSAAPAAAPPTPPPPPTSGSGAWQAPAGTPLGAVMVLQSAPDEFLLLGHGVTLTFAAEDGKGLAGIEDDQAGRMLPDGTWAATRFLNGDQTQHGRHLRFDGDRWSMQRVHLYRYK